MSNTTTFELTIYIAGAGARLQEGGPSAAGHIWYGLSGQNRSYGFAPKDPKRTLEPVVGTDVDDDTQNYQDVAFKATYQVTEAQYQKLLAFGERPFAHGFDNTYWAPTNSCVDFVWAALGHAGIVDNGHQGSLFPVNNRADLYRFVDLPLVEQIDLLREIPNPNGPLPEDPWFGSLPPDALIDELAEAFNNAQTQASPIILDLDGNGVQTVGLGAGVHFDDDANGFAQKSGWLGQGDGLLAANQPHWRQTA